MLITFKCKASPDVTMYEQHVQRIFELLHKEAKIGVITAAETGHAVQLLQGEIARTSAHEKSAEVERDVVAHHGENGDDHGHETTERVAYAARTRPLLDMLVAANKAGNDVLWGI
ncbi:DUF1840 domain-containing protein [Glaciimonas sp. PAMC28666]|uniref:DUF1840 domain-containing protein n=1 Tax=Glaciimonas sp. PAMC28666 TaxID=2807626 RepID=UPI001966C92B|nr:DUF1840 domain-containing protein [Glaciimonas sp. PAMC28666]QRX83760.1 DUF1840 domain-containing protein [Glaciimonas sp. PAMC28666]